MNDTLHACPECTRHVRASETSCPFCAASFASVSRRQLALGGAALTLGAVLTGCSGKRPAAKYGMPPTPDGPEPSEPDPNVPVPDAPDPNVPIDPPPEPDPDIKPDRPAAKYGMPPAPDPSKPDRPAAPKYGMPPVPDPDEGRQMKPMYGMAPKDPPKD